MNAGFSEKFTPAGEENLAADMLKVRGVALNVNIAVFFAVALLDHKHPLRILPDHFAKQRALENFLRDRPAQVLRLPAKACYYEYQGIEFPVFENHTYITCKFTEKVGHV